MLWAIIIILFILWLLGFFGHTSGRVQVPGGGTSLGGVLVVILIIVVVLLLVHAI